ncbi:anion transporter [bacterium]|nr:anion transporter [bacterium]
MVWVVLSIFGITYLGIALGRVPGLMLDRTGIALLGAIAMVVTGAITTEKAVASVDVSTILLLFALMIISAQLRLGGFYTRAVMLLTGMLKRPSWFLLLSMVVSATLSALLANDIICLAFTPVLALSLLRARLNPIPFLIGLAISSNIGSAATIIGNPQNMLIGQVGRLNFADFLIWCAPPAIISFMGSYALILLFYRHDLYRQAPEDQADEPPSTWPEFDRWQSMKGLAAIGILVMLFFTGIPRELSAIAIAGILLCSRKMKSRQILQLVDWHLIMLFCALFIVIQALETTGLPAQMAATINSRGIELGNLHILVIVSTIMSNIFSNVPATILLVQFLDTLNPLQWYTLALSSTFAGNLIVIGSIANLIVIEQAAGFGIKIGFLEHARIGVPVTLFSLLVLMGWISFQAIF